MYFQQNNLAIFSAIQRCAADAPADERRAEGGERTVAGCAGGHEPRSQGDEGRPGEYDPDCHSYDFDCQYFL